MSIYDYNNRIDLDQISLKVSRIKKKYLAVREIGWFFWWNFIERNDPVYLIEYI